MKIDGKQIANKVLEGLKKKVEKLREKNIFPNVAIILVGNDPASIAYINQKKLKGKKIGAKISVKYLSSDVSEPKLLTAIKQLNNDNNIHGIIIQRPLPKAIDHNKISVAVDPKKDVDGFNPKSPFQPPIALAVFRILEEIYRQGLSARHSGERSDSRISFPQSVGRTGRFWASQNDDFKNWLSPQKIVVIGKGETGGKPIIKMLGEMNIQPEVIDRKTPNPKILTQKADIIISAVGKPDIIKPEMLKKGAILIGVGLHKENDGKMHGDYDEEKIKSITSFYTPTPGGVGPVNVAMLLENLINTAENQSFQV